MKIGNKEIGEDKPVFIIAEIGVNHNGSLERAKEMIKKAAECGADAVKFQTLFPEHYVTVDAPKAAYQKKNTGSGGSQLDMLKKLDLKKEDYPELIKCAEEYGLVFLSTPFNEKAADFLEELGVVVFKIGSGDLNNYPFLEYIAKKGKPIILSTGMGNWKEIDKAVEVIVKYNKNFVLLHCITSYPAKPEELNLSVITELKKRYKDLVIGYSDHSPSVIASPVAVALGASVIEKHFTLDKNLPGPDHLASSDPAELKTLIDNIRYIEKTLGSKERILTKSEKVIMKDIRKSIVASRNIKEGHVITEEDIAFKRPGTGMPPEMIHEVIGKKLKKPMKKDEFFKGEFLITELNSRRCLK